LEREARFGREAAIGAEKTKPLQRIVRVVKSENTNPFAAAVAR
jgi:hypothetical protein